VPAGEKTPPAPASAAMSYVAYFLGKEPDARRPITFIYNGGPGSATIWLHMGAFGPKRAVAADGAHGPAAPYRLVDNAHTLLADSDLVFIDAPYTGFGFLRGADKEKAFLGIDEDGRAFTNFIMKFLSTHGRWNSPKFLFGESYGTTRSAVLANMLTQRAVELNGVILLSQTLSFDNSADGPETNPGVDQPYALALPVLRGNRVVSPQVAEPAGCVGAVLGGSRAICAGRVLASLAGRPLPDPASAAVRSWRSCMTTRAFRRRTSRRPTCA
jgi:carboxypeptidase C (cathepsin A)